MPGADVTRGIRGERGVPYDSVDEKIAKEEHGRFSGSWDCGETVIPPCIVPMNDREDCSCEGIGEDLDVCSCYMFGVDFSSIYGTCG